MEWRIYSCCPTFDKTRNLSSRKWDPIKVQQFQAYAFESTFDLNQMKPDDKLLLIFMEDAIPNVKIQFCQFSWNSEIQFFQPGNTFFVQLNPPVSSLVHKINCPVVGLISEALLKMKYWEDVWAFSTCQVLKFSDLSCLKGVVSRHQNQGKPKQLIACKLPIFLSHDDKWRIAKDNARCVIDKLSIAILHFPITFAEFKMYKIGYWQKLN